MRLKSMTVKNFKGIDEHGITIDFAPITILFGPNNAGKSTILQAMLLAREVREIVDNWIDEYNTQRPHQSLGNLTPEEFAIKHKEVSHLVLH